MQEEAIKKITDCMKDCKENRVPAEPIVEFLKGKCGEDKEFATLVMLEHKTLDKCFAFVYEQAKKHLNGTNGWISDNDVYMMAVDYFSIDDEELERKKTEEEKKRKEDRKQQAEEQKKKEADSKKQKARKARQKKEEEKVLEVQLSLF